MQFLLAAQNVVPRRVVRRVVEVGVRTADEQADDIRLTDTLSDYGLESSVLVQPSRLLVSWKEVNLNSWICIAS